MTMFLKERDRRPIPWWVRPLALVLTPLFPVIWLSQIISQMLEDWYHQLVELIDGFRHGD